MKLPSPNWRNATLLVIVALLVFLSQTTMSFSASVRPEPLAQTSYDGIWWGKTSQNQDISFTVINNAITSLSLKFILPGCTAGQTLTFDFPISGNSFSISLPNTSIQGTFSSSLGASGAAQYTSTNPYCTGSISISWNAINSTPPTNTPTHTYTPTSTASPTATSTTSPTATNTTSPTNSPSGQIYLPLVIKQLPPTSTPTPTATLPSGEGSIWTINVTDAYQVTQLRCSQGIDSYTITPKPGYALFIVNLEVHNSQSATVSSENIAVIDSNGTTWEVLASGFSGSYCPSTFWTTYPAGAYSDSFAFVVSESALGQPFKIVFADAAPASFTVRR